MIIVAFHPAARRVGTTTLAASFCEVARENMPRVAAVASGQSPDFEAWIAYVPERLRDRVLVAPSIRRCRAPADLVPGREAPEDRARLQRAGIHVSDIAHA